MNESRTVALSTICIYALWAGVVTTLNVGWVLLILGHPHAALMVAATGGVLTGVAAVATIRCYFNRVSELIRNLHRVQGEQVARLHSINS